MGKINSDRVLVVFILFLSVIIITSLILFVPDSKSVSLLNLKGHPFLGDEKAPIELVLFEDIQCPGCKIFHNNILPQLKMHFLDTGLAKLTIISLPLLEGSELSVKSCLTIFENHPECFQDFFYQLIKSSKNQMMNKMVLLKIAREIKGINIKLFEEKLEVISSNQMQKNMKLAKQVMKNIETPCLYIQGKKIKNITLHEIFYKIEFFLGNRNHG